MSALLCSSLLTLAACQKTQDAADTAPEAVTQGAVSQDNAASDSLAQTSTTGPAFYKVSDDDTTIYIFGTVHLLPEGLNWFEGPLRAAFDASDELVLEMLAPDPQVMQSVALQLAIDPQGLSLIHI